MAYNPYQAGWRNNAPMRGYRTDVLRESGLKRNESQSLMYAIALAAPAEYRQKRVELERAITHDLTTALYEVVYAALLSGQTRGGIDLVTFEGNLLRYTGGATRYDPNIPERQVNEIAYECATGLIRILTDKVVDQIMPPDLSKMANEKIAAKTTTRIAANEY